MKKYELTDNTKNVCGHILHQIRYLRDIGNNIMTGDLGGWIENEDNLSQYGHAQVCGDALVYGNARVADNAKVYGNAKVYDNAKVYCYAAVSGNANVSGNAVVFDDVVVSGNAVVIDNAVISGNAWVSGNARVSGNAKVYDNAKLLQIYDLLVIGPIGSRRSFTSFYRTKDEKIFVSCGCFYGDINAFRNKVCETHAGHPKHLSAYLYAIDFAEKLIEGRRIT